MHQIAEYLATLGSDTLEMFFEIAVRDLHLHHTVKGAPDQRKVKAAACRDIAAEMKRREALAS